MKRRVWLHVYYTLLFVIFIYVMIDCTASLIWTINNFADAVNYASNGTMRFNFTDSDGD